MHDGSEFTLLGDAVWLDFVNTRAGPPAHPPDLPSRRRRARTLGSTPCSFPGRTADSFDEVRTLRTHLTALAEALAPRPSRPAGQSPRHQRAARPQRRAPTS